MCRWLLWATSAPFMVGALAATLVLAVACTGAIGGAPSGPGGSGVDDSAAEGGQAGDAPGPFPRSPNGVLDEACGSEVGIAPAPLARLTAFEYTRTLATLFSGVTLPSLPVPDDQQEKGTPFDSFAGAQTASAALVESLQANAKQVATAALAQPQKWLSCAPSSGAPCAEKLVTEFGARVFRRPLSNEEVQRYVGFYKTVATTYSADVGARMLLEALLQSPQLLYRIEAGVKGGARSAPLNSFELASRLSYFLWDTMPDAELMKAASENQLQDASSLERHARRLLEDPKARQAVAHFHAQWLQLKHMEKIKKAPAVFASWSDKIANSLRVSTEQFIDHAFWDTEGLKTILTAPQSFVNKDLAGIVGAAAEGDGFKMVKLSATERAGLLTQPGLLAGLAHEDVSAPVLRGVFVLDRFLCAAPPPAPDTTPTQTPTRPVVTTRDKFEFSHTGPTCQACHESIDGIGFAFEHYDAIGKFRTEENGQPINAQGEASDFVDGTFDGAVELSQRLAQSPLVRDCLAAQWLAYSQAIAATQLDACSLQPVAKGFADGQLSMRELLVSIVKSPTFRLRTAEQP